VLLARLGNGAGDKGRVDLQVRAVQAAKHGDLWVDTSSARSILPGLVEWAVKELGMSSATTSSWARCSAGKLHSAFSADFSSRCSTTSKTRR